ncbi:sodium/hydrogen exchanger family protein, partial [Vibrio parahaemolyticus V-223/04]
VKLAQMRLNRKLITRHWKWVGML